MNIHVNTHLAFGTFTTLLFTAIFPGQLSFFEVAACILSACVVDVDFLFSKFMKYHNHRLLPTHSAVMPAALFIIAIVLTLGWPAMSSLSLTAIICGINVLIDHDLVDSYDWGLNFFLNGKIVGKKILIGNKTPDEYYQLASKYVPEHAPFIKKYYESNIMRALEIIAFSLMVISLLLSWNGAGHEQWWVLICYVGFLGFHLHYYIKEVRNNPGIPTI
ncbi:MAG TPA: hypothetical protein VKM55_21840 [Candidatus Lokiarchaeia archaeon]|nr:hypothetical protein [Candidatus Lokiarchaeia archaeon]